MDCRTRWPRGQLLAEHVHAAGARLRCRIDSAREGNTADIMPVQGRATQDAVGGMRESLASFLFPITGAADALYTCIPITA